ncbi:hypothetical protein ACFL7M_09900 [Thermodesulfobacteriota bacterium]
MTSADQPVLLDKTGSDFSSVMKVHLLNPIGMGKVKTFHFGLADALDQIPAKRQVVTLKIWLQQFQLSNTNIIVLNTNLKSTFCQPEEFFKVISQAD